MTDTVAPANAAAPDASAPKVSTRARLFRILAVALIVGAVIVAAWWFIYGSRVETTDDAYVGGDVASITPLLNGTVTRVNVTDTQTVHQGDVLVELDGADARVAYDQALAELQRAERRVKGYAKTDTALAAQVAGREAEAARSAAQADQAKAALDKAEGDLRRRLAANSDGAVSGEEIATARNAVASARATFDAAIASYREAKANALAAKGTLATNHTLVEGTSLNANPEVAAARAKLEQAQLDLSRSAIRAPIDGVIARRSVQIGQRVQAGTALMTVVPLNNLYVDANFKEDQLRKMKPGLSVELTADRYGDGVVYHGKVVGFAGGTGAAFSLIPAQNATGNWIKVVQRVPVRISLDPAELRAHPLLVGLSMNAKVKFDQ